MNDALKTGKTIEDITESPEHWEMNVGLQTFYDMLAQQLLVHGKPVGYIVGPPRDPKTKEIDCDLAENNIWGLYKP